MPVLTIDDRKLLKASYFSKNDIHTISSSIESMMYFLKDSSGVETSITPERAIIILGREEWVRGVAKATFFSNTTRTGLFDEKVVIRIKDSSR